MRINDQEKRVPTRAATPQGTSSRPKMKPVLLALGVSGLAVLGVEAVRTNINDVVAASILPPVPAKPNMLATDAVRETLGAALTPDVPTADPPNAAPVDEPSVGTRFAIGDRIKLAFYERIAVEDDKWGRNSSAMRGIVQRPEMSGEYAVQEDGTISLPLLGTVTAAGKSPQQFTASVVENFEQTLGHKGMVNIVSLERSPIFVLGPVKNSGSFKYASGMTVLHAVALAGGLDRGSGDSYMKVETVREIQKRSGAANSMLKLLARVAVLKAERDGVAPKIPVQLMEMVGASEAKSLLDEQSERRKPMLLARQERQRAIAGALDAAKQDIQAYGRTDSLDQLVKTRQERVDSTRALVERNVLGKAVLSQVQGELSDAEQRRQDALNQYGMAKQRLASMQADGIKVQSDLKNELVVEIDMIERQLADNEREFRTSEGVLSSLPATRSQFPSAKQTNRIGYSIVRQTSKGPVNIESDGLTSLQPGDLVNVMLGADDAIEQQPAMPAQQPPPALQEEKSQTGRSVMRTTGRSLAQD
ncbi:polysaccharide biosynthesis/export family protein [Tardiphaga sp.]|jgi:exopolysaccharide production protein ExoF|uniref:polysaccharide biosynthesis/export family protein n=1 Tax=Tardiphaga sp. TaxID=1926292 RepID=UPI0037D9DD74